MWLSRTQAGIPNLFAGRHTVNAYRFYKDTAGQVQVQINLFSQAMAFKRRMAHAEEEGDDGAGHQLQWLEFLG